MQNKLQNKIAEEALQCYSFRIMSQEIISQVIEAEKSADPIIETAKKEAFKIKIEAHHKTEEILNEWRESGEKERKIIIDNAKSAGAIEAQKLLSSAKEEISNILQNGSGKIIEARKLCQ